MTMVLLPLLSLIKAFVPEGRWGRNIWVRCCVPLMVVDVHFPQVWIAGDAFSRTLPNLGA